MTLKKPRVKTCGVKAPAWAAAALLLALVFLAQPAVAAVVAAGQPESLRVAFSKDAYWYKPADKVQMRVTLDNPTRQAMEDVSIKVRVHTPNTTRSDLDACFSGKPRKSYRQTETYGPYALHSGNNGFNLELELGSSRYSNGVYPLTVEVARSGAVMSSVVSELVIMSFEESEKLVPLKLSWVFDTLEPPHRDPGGNFKNEALARECDPSGKNPGWYPTLLGALEKWQDLRFSLALSPMLLEDMQAMTGGYVVKSGEKARNVRPDSRQAANASAVLIGLGRLPQSARHQLLPEPYASCDLEELISLGWREDARQQLSRGHKLLEEILDITLSRQFACPPGLNANSSVLAELKNELGQFLVLSPRLLERSREGRKLLQGMTLGSPVFIKGAGDERKDLALFADARMQRLLERISASGDPHGVAQCIISELTSLYLEQPAKLRACAVVAPGSWHPSRDVLDEVMRALNGTPWLSTVTLEESMVAVPPTGEAPLKIPGPEKKESADEYWKQVGAARDNYAAFRDVVLPDNPFLAPLQRDVYVSESVVWRQWDRLDGGLEYAGFVDSTVAGELSKVDMPAISSITLTSGSAKVPLSVVNGTGYRIKALLKYSSNGLTFPAGAEQKVLLEPKENLLEIPVKVRKKGRVHLSVRLEAEGFSLGELDFTVLTSRFNAFAIVVVGSLLALIGIVWAARVIARRKVGKHKKQQLKEATKEQGKGAEA